MNRFKEVVFKHQEMIDPDAQKKGCILSEKLQEPEFQYTSYFPYLVRMFYKDVSQSVRDVYMKRFELSVSEWRTMTVLYHFEPLSAKGIVERSSIDKVNVSRSLSSLKKRNLLKRFVDPIDRRRALVSLTKKGKQVMGELAPLVLEIEGQLLSGITESELTAIKVLMNRIRKNAQNIQTKQAG